MLTKHTYSGLIKFYKLASALQACPYFWDRDSRKLRFSKRLHRRLISYAITVHYVGFAVSCINTFVRGCLYNNRKLSSMAIDMCFAVAYFCFAAFDMNLYLREKPLMNLLNCALQLDEEYTAKFSHLPPLKSDGCDILILAFYYVTFPMSACFLGFFLENPHNLRYLLALFPGEKKPLWLISAWSVWEYFTIVHCSMIWDTFCFTLLVYTNSSVYWLKFLCRSCGSNSRETRSIENGGIVALSIRRSKGVRMYRVLHVLNVNFNFCYSRIFFPAFLLFLISTHIQCNYITIKFHGKMSIIIYSTFIMVACMWSIIEAFVIPTLGTLQVISRAFKQTCTTLSHSTLAKRESRAMAPLGIKVSSVYTLKKTTVLVIVMAIINFTVNFIIMT